MYKLGDQFTNNYVSNLVSEPGAIIKSNCFRITILTERLVRLEYSGNGIFNNYETSVVKNRKFRVPDYTKQEDDNILKIDTRYFTLTYYKNTSFNSRTIKAKCKGNSEEWYYSQKEVKNFNSCAMSLDNMTKMPELEKGLFSPTGIATIDDSDALCFDENRNIVSVDKGKDYVDLYLFIYDKDFALCLKDYFTLTGFPAMIPRYALGNWWSKECDYKDYEVLDKIERFKMHGIPISVFLLDDGWSKRDNKYPNIKTGFSFNEEYYSNPTDFINKVHDSGLKFGLKINPQYGFYPFENNFEYVSKYLPVNNEGYVNFSPSDLKCVDVLFKVLTHPLETLGVDFFWNDYNTTDKKRMYLMNYYMKLDSLRNNKRNLTLSRNSTFGAHLFNVLYSGRNVIDWNTLKMLPFYTLNSANIGACFWSHDIAGSTGGIEDNDFYLRSIQLGVFSPILRFNTVRGLYFKREPWKWDVVTNSIASDCLRLRHKLIPYIYSECYDYHKHGKLLIQPFYYYNLKFYDDENYSNQYYFGSSFMISPIIKPMDPDMNRTIQRFFLPEGVWYDFQDGKRFAGNHKYIGFYSIDNYPIFVKQGSIIPMAGPNSYMSYKNPKDLEIHVFPGISNTYHLYEDDGETYNYQDGRYCITEIDYNYRKSNYTLIIRPIEGDLNALLPTRDYKIVFRNTKKSDHVVVYENDKVLDNIETEVTETNFIVYIKDINTKSQLVINCYGEDIEIDSVKLIKDDIDSILFDLKIYTNIKDEIASIVFNDNLSLGKKRIAIKKLKRKGLDPRSIKIFLRLLEYMEM
jgi:alpha-glucosidase (family GH31 glycosyl hydrolase)